MRLIGITADPQKADTFVGYLDHLGKGAMVRPEADQFAVWVFDEGEALDARLDWQRFVAHPDHEDFRVPAKPQPESLPSETTKVTHLQNPAVPRPVGSPPRPFWRPRRWRLPSLLGLAKIEMICSSASPLAPWSLGVLYLFRLILPNLGEPSPRFFSISPSSTSFSIS